MYSAAKTQSLLNLVGKLLPLFTFELKAVSHEQNDRWSEIMRNAKYLKNNLKHCLSVKPNW